MSAVQYDDDMYGSLTNRLENGGEGTPSSKNDAEAGIDCKFNDDDDIRMTLVLGSLIYTLDQMRQIARENHLERDFGYRDEDDFKRKKHTTEDAHQYQMIVGKFDYINADATEKAPGVALNPAELQKLLQRFELFKDLRDDPYTQKNIEVLEELDKHNDTIYINNFNAVDNCNEVVYAITALEKARPEKKDKLKDDGGNNQIAVVFRGSVYSRDWLHNISVSQVELRISLITNLEQAWLVEGSGFFRIQMNFELAKTLQDVGEIKVHRGFLEYLFAKESNSENSKYGAIRGNLNTLMDHPKFNHGKSDLTITGHSLGGALATLLSFFLACDKDVTKEISCISFAAPLVGNKGFQKAYRILENKEKCLKHVRITNECDFVPLAPPLLNYCHTGVQVHLRGKNWFGIEQGGKISDTGSDSKSSLCQFIGCMLTTFPPVILFPLYFLWRHVSAVIVIIVFVGLLQVETYNKDGEKSDNKNGAKSVWRQSVSIAREKVLPSVALFYLISEAASSFLILPGFLVAAQAVFCHPVLLIIKLVSPLLPFLGLDALNIVTKISNAVEEQGDWFFIKLILLSQVVAFARQPQHILGLGTTDEKGETLGLTHALSFYDSNLTKAKQASKQSNDLPSFRSSNELWEHGIKNSKN